MLQLVSLSLVKEIRARNAIPHFTPGFDPGAATFREKGMPSTTLKSTAKLSKYFAKTSDEKPQEIFSHVLKDIQSFNKNKLRKREVYFVGGPPESYLPSYLHSFPVVGAVKNKKSESSYASLRYLSANIMLAHFFVSDAIVNTVMKSANFSHDTKSAIQAFKGQTFPSIEIFFRELLKKRENRENITEDICIKAAFPDEELQKLAKLNEDVNHNRGVVVPGNPDEGRRKTDRARFESNSMRLTIVPYPNIEPDIIDDLFNQLKLYMAWMNEQAGIGKNTEYWIKEHVHPEKTKQIIDAQVHYKSSIANPVLNFLGVSLLQFLTLPDKNCFFETNCNKSSASLLDEAEKRSAEKQHRQAQEIKGPTWFHQKIGAAQRILIWNPLKPNFIGIIKQLVTPTHVNYPIPSLQDLVANKKNILQVIQGFELSEQIKALEQITNRRTLLGKAFATVNQQNCSCVTDFDDLITAEQMLEKARKLYEKHIDALMRNKAGLEEARAKHTEEEWLPKWDAMKPKM